MIVIFGTQVLMHHSVFQEPYLTWLLFLVQLCKMMISPAFFFHFFEILIFRGFRRGLKGKNTHNYHFQSVTLYLKNCKPYHQDV